MTNNMCKRGEISTVQIFFILLVSRIVVSLTYIQAVSVGRLSGDLIISLMLGCVFTVLISIPAMLCIKNNKSPITYHRISWLYGVYFVYFAAIGISRLAYFTATRQSTALPMTVFALIICVCAGYCAYMGLEGMGRFSVLCGVVLVAMVFVVTGLNADGFKAVNFYPFVQNSTGDILKNAVLFMSNSIEPAVMLMLAHRVNGKRSTALVLSVISAFVIITLLIVFCLGVMGSASTVQAYPVYALSQLASIGAMSRLDIFHTAFWIMGLLLKTAILIYTSSLCASKFRHKTKCIMAVVVIMLICILIAEVIGMEIITISKIVGVIMCSLFVVIIPLIILFDRRRKNEMS